MQEDPVCNKGSILSSKYAACYSKKKKLPGFILI